MDASESVRKRLAQAALLLCLLALTATSAPPKWWVEDDASESVSFTPGSAGRRIAQAVVLYRAPRGAWPLSLSASGYPYIATIGIVGDPTEDEGVRRTDGTDAALVRSASYEIVCREKLCEGMITASVVAEYAPESRAWFDGGFIRGTDGGLLASNAVAVSVEAQFRGGVEDDFVDCNRKDSSTDSEAPPKELGLTLTLEPFEDDPTAPPVPDRVEASDAGVLGGLDASAAFDLDGGASR